MTHTVLRTLLVLVMSVVAVGVNPSYAGETTTKEPGAANISQEKDVTLHCSGPHCSPATAGSSNSSKPVPGVDERVKSHQQKNGDQHQDKMKRNKRKRSWKGRMENDDHHGMFKDRGGWGWGRHGMNGGIFYGKHEGMERGGHDIFKRRGRWGRHGMKGGILYGKHGGMERGGHDIFKRRGRWGRHGMKGEMHYGKHDGEVSGERGNSRGTDGAVDASQNN